MMRGNTKVERTLDKHMYVTSMWHTGHVQVKSSEVMFNPHDLDIAPSVTTMSYLLGTIIFQLELTFQTTLFFLALFLFPSSLILNATCFYYWYLIIVFPQTSSNHSYSTHHSSVFFQFHFQFLKTKAKK